MQGFKPISRFIQKHPVLSLLTTFFPVQLATLVFFGGIGFFAAIAVVWLLGDTTLNAFFLQLQFWQENPPTWITTPHFTNSFYLFLPALIILIFLQTILKLSPYPRAWSRFIVVSILLALLSRYICWRSLSTLNLSNPIDGIFSLSLWSMEFLVFIGEIIYLTYLFTLKERRQETEQYAQAVLEGSYTPSVDILIPTFNEPEVILKRTIVGCQALDYPRKNIYLLDDTKRPQIKKLAQDLGCYYITRPDNRYAKAGNLNHAIAQTQGELIVVFDADFIPTKNFLKRTVGFFQNQKIALVQTPQSFYNSDPIARNLGLGTGVTAEEEVFHRQSQLVKDGARCIVCSGSSFVVRRQHLEEVGNFVTDSISEDYYTGIELSAKGYEVIYLNEKLSAGLTAESIPAYITQRLRWARGTLQGFFIKSNPLTISGLTLRQRIGHFLCFLTWFYVIPRLLFMLMPFFYFLFGIIAIKVSWQEFVYMFLPYYLAQMSVFHWLTFRSRSIIFSELYSLVSFIPVTITIFKVMLNPFQERFKVTPKGTYRNQYIYNWRLALPLFLILIITVLGMLVNIKTFDLSNRYFDGLSLIWGTYNLFFIGLTLLALLDHPKSNPYDSYTLKYPVELMVNNQRISGITETLSEVGAEISLSEKIEDTKLVYISFLEENLELSGKIGKVICLKNPYRVKVEFMSLSLQQERKLIELIFCQPGRWMNKSTPGELQSLQLLIGVLGRNLTSLLTKRKMDQT